MGRDAILATIAVTLAGGVVCQALARRLHMPAIVPLLLAGVALGPVGLGWVQPDALGDLKELAIGFAVAVILFEGGLSLKTESFRLAGPAIRRLVTIGSLLTWAQCGIGAALLFPELQAGTAALFGALVIVTGPTVIMPLLQAIHPRQRVADVLKGEAILIDPVGALLAVLTLEFVLEAGHEGGLGAVASAFAGRIGLGTLIGVGGAIALNAALRRQHATAPDLKNRTVLVGALALYAVSELLSPESGVLTVTVAGFLLGWMNPPGIEDVEEFKGHIVALLVSFVFILLSAGLSLDAMRGLGWRGLVLVGAVMLVARPVTVFLGTAGTELSRKEKLFLSWIAPRGIVAAAVSSLFAIVLARTGDPDLAAQGQMVMALTFAVIAGTVLVQGPTARWVGRFLGMLRPAPTGFLIVGGNKVGRALGRALHGSSVQVQLLDTNYGEVRRARETGLPARRTNALDDHAMQTLDLEGIGYLMATTPNDLVNRLAVRLWTPVLGHRNVRALRTQDSPEQTEENAPPWLFGQRLSFENMARLLDEGATIEVASIDEPLEVRDFPSRLDGAVPLLAFDNKRGPRFLDDDAELEEGETLYYLQPESGVATPEGETEKPASQAR